MKTIGIIPARYQSSRFPGKPLVDIQGKTLIRRVYEQAIQSKTLDAVIVATDDPRIYRHVQSFTSNVKMTGVAHRSGTDRCAEVARGIKDAEIVVNIQGDEPFINPAQIDLVADQICRNERVAVATLVKKIEDVNELQDADIVKVVLNDREEAIYFSRSPIPFIRQAPQNEWLKQFDFYKHIGLYAFRSDVLQQLCVLPPGRLEQAESLEQLRWLEAGFRIGVNLTELETLGIDTPEDLDKVEEYL